MNAVALKGRTRHGVATVGRRLVVAALLSVAVCGCSRWRPNSPVEIGLRESSDAFSRTLASLRGLGYAVVEQDPSAGYIRVLAKTVAHTNVAGGQVAAPDSWFAVQVYSGRVVLRASGYLVRDDDTVRRNSLDDEMQRLAENLRADVGR